MRSDSSEKNVRAHRPITVPHGALENLIVHDELLRRLRDGGVGGRIKNAITHYPLPEKVNFENLQLPINSPEETDQITQKILKSQSDHTTTKKEKAFTVWNVGYSILASSTFALLSFDDRKEWEKQFSSAESNYSAGAVMFAASFFVNAPMAYEYMRNIPETIRRIKARFDGISKTQKGGLIALAVISVAMGVCTFFPTFGLTMSAFEDFSIGDSKPFVNPAWPVATLMYALSGFAGLNSVVTRMIGLFFLTMMPIDFYRHHLGPNRDIYRIIADLEKYGDRVSSSSGLVDAKGLLEDFYQQLGSVREARGVTIAKNIFWYGARLTLGVAGVFCVWPIFMSKSHKGLQLLFGEDLTPIAYMGTLAHVAFYFNAGSRFLDSLVETGKKWHGRMGEYSRGERTGVILFSILSAGALLISGAGLNEAADKVQPTSFWGIPGANPYVAWAMASIVNADAFCLYVNRKFPHYFREILPEALFESQRTVNLFIERAVAQGRLTNGTEKVVAIEAYQVGLQTAYQLMVKRAKLTEVSKSEEMVFGSPPRVSRETIELMKRNYCSDTALRKKHDDVEAPSEQADAFALLDEASQTQLSPDVLDARQIADRLRERVETGRSNLRLSFLFNAEEAARIRRLESKVKAPTPLDEESTLLPQQSAAKSSRRITCGGCALL